MPPLLIFRVWLALGAQSFGGGSATLTLIRREIVERRGWMTDAEFTRDWTLCQVAPGVNLLGITILIGRRLGGASGIALALAGLLMPSVGATVLLTAFYAHFQHLTAVRAAIRGVIPGTVGLGLLTAYQIAAPVLRQSRAEGRWPLTVSCLLLVGSGFCAATGKAPVVLILCAAGAFGAGANWAWDTLRRWRDP